MKRIAVWAVIGIALVALVALGALIHAGTPPTPRWSRPTSCHTVPALRLIDGGRRLVLAHVAAPRCADMPLIEDAPIDRLHVYDTATGERLASLWPSGLELNLFTLSASGRWAVTVRRDLLWADLRTGVGRERRLAEEDAGFAEMTEVGELIVLHEAGVTTVLDPATGGEVLRHATRRKDVLRGGMIFCHDDDGRLTAWDAAARRAVAALPDAVDRFDVTPDGQGVIAETPDGRRSYWRLDDPARPRRLDADPGIPLDGLVSPGGRWLVPVCDGARFWDLRTGRLWWDAGPGDLPSFSPDGRACLFGGPPVGGRRVLFPEERRAGPPVDPPGICPHLSPEGRLIHIVDDRLTAHDGRTGELMWEYRSRSDVTGNQQFSPDGGRLWFTAIDGGPDEGGLLGWLRRLLCGDRPTQSGALIGVDWPSGREVLLVTGPLVRKFEPAADGAFVVTWSWDERGGCVSRYDVPPPKPWAWVVGAPLALGAALLGLRRLASGTRQGAEESQR